MIDRLSDVAGPLRPSERIEPYLAGYPLPSGQYYVLARTWPDLTVARAGCVRTHSLVIPASEWARVSSLSLFLDLLAPSAFPQTEEATCHKLSLPKKPEPIQPVWDFRGEELLEALFLEATKPIVVFGAEEPELIATRLLTAMWPDLRRGFAFSTFVRSPRRIEGRYFDLVFAPKDARSKFADWPGRRIDGTADNAARHRWTGDIVDRVFVSPLPRLLPEAEVRWAKSSEANSPGLLRISLLWHELIDKVTTTPTAALGLLDIANSRESSNRQTLEALDGAITLAVRTASSNMPSDQAWEFVSALARKMRGHDLHEANLALRDEMEHLSATAPQGAIEFLSQPIPKEIWSNVMPAIASGISRAPEEQLSSALLSASTDVFGRLLIANDLLARRTIQDAGLLQRVGEIVSNLEPQLFLAIRENILPLLIEERQADLAAYFISTLDLDSLMIELRHLARVADMALAAFIDPIVSRARELDGTRLLREVLLEFPPHEGRDKALFATLMASPEDVSWLLAESRVQEDLAREWLVAMLMSASSAKFTSIFSDPDTSSQVIAALQNGAINLKRRILSEGGLALDAYVALLLDVAPALYWTEAQELLEDALSRCLLTHFGQNETQTIVRLIGALGNSLDAKWAVNHSLVLEVPSSIASRNLIAFDSAPAAPRGRILLSVDNLANALNGRHRIDVDEPAITAVANLLADATHHAQSAAFVASRLLLPLLMRSQTAPVSRLIAVAFPVVYQEYAKADDIPELLKFVPFVYWDQRKSARRDLVSAFLGSSVWAPGDLALTSCRCGEVARIFEHVADSFGGEAYLKRVLNDLETVRYDCRQAVEKAITGVMSG